MTNKGWTQVGEVRSTSRPSTYYYIISQHTDGYYGCGCPSWTKHRGAPHERTCKHLKKFLEERGLTNRIEQKRDTPVYRYDEEVGF